MKIQFRRVASVAAVVAVMLPLTACDTDKLLAIIDPDQVTPATLDDVSQINTIIAGAISEFNQSYSGAGGDRFTSNVALFTDELMSTGTFSTRTATDRRNLFTPDNGNTHDSSYRELQVARRALKDAAESLVRFELQSDPRFAQMKALEGFTYVALAEGFCSPIPFSDVVDGVREDGVPVTGTAALNLGIERFDAAIGASSGDFGTMAKLGKARALLMLGNVAGAASAVAGVSTDFFIEVEHSDNSGGQNNPVWSLQSNGRYALSDAEGGNGAGLNFRTGHQVGLVGDPRSAWWEDPNRGFDPVFPLFVTRRHNRRTSNSIIADGIDARLIEAEAALASGNTTSWLTLLNDLRANVDDLLSARVDDYMSTLGGNAAAPNTVLNPLTDPGTAAGRVDLMFQERGFWMFAQGRRLGDLRRLVNDYGRSAGDVYPSGVYHKGGQHGTDVVFNLDFDEINNLSYDPSACNTTSTAF